MARERVSRIIFLVVAVTLVIALIVATVLVSLKPEEEFKGVLTSADVVQETSVYYSVETEGEFKQDVTRFLNNVLSSFIDSIYELKDVEITVPGSSNVSTPLINIFSKSAIPSDKLLNFGEYLKNLDTDDAVTKTWLFLIELEEQPDGKLKARFSTPSELAQKFTTEVNFGYAVTDLVAHTALTAEESGRLLYELAVIFADDEQREVLTTVGRQNLVDIFVSTTTVYEAYATFSLEGGTLRDARLIGELSYELGARLDEIINEVGISKLLLAIMLSEDKVTDNGKLAEFLTEAGVDASTLADMLEVKEAFSRGVELAEFVVYFMRTTLMEVGNSPFEHLAIYYEGEKANLEHYLYMYQLSLSRAVKKGMDYAFQAGTIIKNEEELVTALANFKLSSEDVSTDIGNKEERLEQLKGEFKEYLDHVTALAEGFESVVTVEDIATLSEAGVALLKEHSYFLNDFNYNGLTTGTEDLLTTLILNMTFNVFSDVANEALSGAVSK